METTWSWTPRIIKNRIRKMEERIAHDPRDYGARFLLEKWRKRLHEAEQYETGTDGD